MTTNKDMGPKAAFARKLVGTLRGELRGLAQMGAGLETGHLVAMLEALEPRLDALVKGAAPSSATTTPVSSIGSATPAPITDASELPKNANIIGRAANTVAAPSAPAPLTKAAPVATLDALRDEAKTLKGFKGAHLYKSADKLSAAIVKYRAENAGASTVVITDGKTVIAPDAPPAPPAPPAPKSHTPRRPVDSDGKKMIRKDIIKELKTYAIVSPKDATNTTLFAMLTKARGERKDASEALKPTEAPTAAQNAPEANVSDGSESPAFDPSNPADVFGAMAQIIAGLKGKGCKEKRAEGMKLLTKLGKLLN